MSMELGDDSSSEVFTGVDYLQYCEDKARKYARENDIFTYGDFQKASKEFDELAQILTGNFPLHEKPVRLDAKNGFIFTYNDAVGENHNHRSPLNARLLSIYFSPVHLGRFDDVTVDALAAPGGSGEIAPEPRDTDVIDFEVIARLQPLIDIKQTWHQASTHILIGLSNIKEISALPVRHPLLDEAKLFEDAYSLFQQAAWDEEASERHAENFVDRRSNESPLIGAWLALAFRADTLCRLPASDKKNASDQGEDEFLDGTITAQVVGFDVGWEAGWIGDDEGEDAHRHPFLEVKLALSDQADIEKYGSHIIVEVDDIEHGMLLDRTYQTPEKNLILKHERELYDGVLASHDLSDDLQVEVTISKLQMRSRLMGALIVAGFNNPTEMMVEDAELSRESYVAQSGREIIGRICDISVIAREGQEPKVCYQLSIDQDPYLQYSEGVTTLYVDQKDIDRLAILDAPFMN